MAEKRSDYSDENYQPSPKEAGDPLAELARLIGQSDPFADGARTAARKPADALRPGDRPAPEWLARPATADDYDQQHAPRDSYRADPHYQQQHDDQPEAAAHDERYAHDASHERYSAHASAEQHDAQYDDRYRVAPPPAGDYDGDNYYADDGHMPPHAEEHVPSRRRSGLLMAAAAIGLAVVGTAGAFGYRALTSGPGGSANPPVIKADTAPAKIVPPPAPSADAQGKPFQERAGTASVVVPREEQPVSLPVPPQPRPGAPQNAFTPSTAAPLVAAPPSTVPGASAEPKRVRTTRITPDSAGGIDATASQPPAASGSRVAPIAIAPPQPEPTQPRTKTASRTPAPTAGSYAVQVSAQKSEAEAQSSYQALQQKYPAVLGGRSANIRRVDLGDKGGVFYRAQVGSFATMEQATTLCNNLKEIGGQCIVQRN